MQITDIFTFIVRMFFVILPFVGIITLPLLISKSIRFRKMKNKVAMIVVIFIGMIGGFLIGSFISTFVLAALYGIESAAGNCLGASCILGR